MNAPDLTQDQQQAFKRFTHFLADPEAQVLVIRGYSGTGKSTLVAHCVEQYPKLMETLRLLDPNRKKGEELEIQLTATTNKAAEALASATHCQVRTIQSVLGLRVHTDYGTGKTELRVKRGATPVEDLLLFIDEASYIDRSLMEMVFKQTQRCKIVFVGDPAQLLTVNCTHSPVFNAGFDEVRMTQVVRQADDNPIVALSAKFRDTVEQGEWFSFVPDNQHIQHMPREAFDKAVAQEFTRTGRQPQDSRVLAWTNKRVIAYNKAIAALSRGTSEFNVGDYAVCNQHVSNGTYPLRTDQQVLITHIGHVTKQHEVPGRFVQLDNRAEYFMPLSKAEWDLAIRTARKRGDPQYILQEMTDQWVDLRELYSSTINKAQGSTYNQVFIDLDDLSKCNNSNQLARMLYVGVSRARERVYLTGDIT